MEGRKCKECSECRECKECRECRECRKCRECRECRECSECSECKECRECRECKECRVGSVRSVGRVGSVRSIGSVCSKTAELQADQSHGNELVFEQLQFKLDKLSRQKIGSFFTPEGSRSSSETCFSLETVTVKTVPPLRLASQCFFNDNI